MPAIILLTLTRWNTIRLPQEALKHLNGAKLVKIRFARGRLRIYPYNKATEIDWSAIPFVPELDIPSLRDAKPRRIVPTNTNHPPYDFPRIQTPPPCERQD